MQSDCLGTCIKEIQGKYTKNLDFFFGLKSLFPCGSGYLVYIAQMVSNWKRLRVEQYSLICK